jgi:hypothetical protein
MEDLLELSFGSNYAVPVLLSTFYGVDAPTINIFGQNRNTIFWTYAAENKDFGEQNPW